MVNQGVTHQIRSYSPTSDINFTIPTFKFSVFLLSLIRELSKLVHDILRNHRSKASGRDPYLWMWNIFAEPESSKDERLCRNFWENVMQKAQTMMNKDIRQTQNTGLFSSAYSYLRANFGTNVREAYANLKQVFGISSDNYFNLFCFSTKRELSAIFPRLMGKFFLTSLNLTLKS